MKQPARRGGQTLDPDPYLLHVFAMAEDIAEWLHFTVSYGRLQAIIG